MKKGRRRAKRQLPRPQRVRIRAGHREWLPALLASVYLLVLPWVMSFSGFDAFRLPKDVFAAISILALFLTVLLLGRFRFSLPLCSWEFVLALGMVYTGVHVFLSSDSPGALRGYISLLLFVLLFASLKALSNPVFQRWIWFGITGVMAVNAVLTVLQYFGWFAWMTNATGVILSGRLNPAGFIGEVNSGGFLFGLAALMATYYVVAEKRIWVRIAASFFLSLNLMGLAFTRTLTAILALSACALLWLVFHHWWWFRETKRVTRSLFLFWLILLAGLGGSLLLSYQAGVAERVQSVVNLARKGEWSFATAGRQPVYYLTWQMIKERPVLGHGLNTFQRDFFYFRTDTEAGRSVRLLSQPGAFRQVHNEYLQVWEELGLPGLAFLLLLLAIPFYRSIVLLRSETDRATQYWIGISTTALVFIAISCFSFFPLHLAVTATYIVLILAGLRLLQSAEKGGGRTWNDSSAERRAAAVDEGASSAPDSSRRGSFWESVNGLRFGVPVGARGMVLLRVVLVLLAAFLGVFQVERWFANQEVGLAAYLLQQSSQGRYRPASKRMMADEALSRLERAESLDAGFSEIHNLRGSALMLVGKYEAARKSYLEASRRLPSPEVFTNLAAACIATEDWQAAWKYVRKALRYDPAFPKARDALKYLKETKGGHADRD